MSSLTIKAGRLISTSDMQLARKLQKTIKLVDITGGATPQAVKQTANTISFMFCGEYYELEAVA